MKEPTSSLKEMLSKLTIGELEIGPDGKITTTDHDLALVMKKLKGVLSDSDPVNGSGCQSGPNTGCGKKAM